MEKIILTLCFLLAGYFTIHAQRTVQDHYYDFTVYRTSRGEDGKVQKIKALLEQRAGLTEKQIANAEYHLGRMYEEMGLVDSALVHYKESIKGEPNYTVIHRAMAFIYLDQTKPFIKQMNEASANKNAAANIQAFEKYRDRVRKALPHLEKYQSCESDDETLAIIVNLYKSIKQQDAIAKLDARLKALSGNCVDLLADE